MPQLRMWHGYLCTLNGIKGRIYLSIAPYQIYALTYAEYLAIGAHTNDKHLHKARKPKATPAKKGVTPPNNHTILPPAPRVCFQALHPAGLPSTIIPITRPAHAPLIDPRTNFSKRP
jgi:hypothetical protein